MSRQHTDKLLDSPSAGLGFLGGLNPKQNRVAIFAVQAREEGFSFGVLVERGLQIVRYRPSGLRSERAWWSCLRAQDLCLRRLPVSVTIYRPRI